MNIRDEKEYIHIIETRARYLIQSKIWDSISEQSLENWISGLKVLRASLLGAYILDNLAFRTKNQYSALLDVLIDQVEVCVSNTQPAIPMIEAFNRRTKYPIALSPVIGMNEPPTKSGPYILRLAQRRFKLNSARMYWPHQLIQLEELNQVIFIDDFCGTGNQFLDFLDSINFDQLLLKFPHLKVSYAVTTLHENGLNTIKSKYSDITIYYSEYLTHSNSNLLHDKFLDRYEVDGFKEQIREQYEEVCLAIKPPSKFKYGYGDLGLSYAFAHSTPNNSLPILWRGTEVLPPLVER